MYNLGTAYICIHISKVQISTQLAVRQLKLHIFHCFSATFIFVVKVFLHFVSFYCFNTTQVTLIFFLKRSRFYNQFNNIIWHWLRSFYIYNCETALLITCGVLILSVPYHHFCFCSHFLSYSKYMSYLRTFKTKMKLFS